MTNATVRQSTANERYVKRQVSVIRVCTCSERHLTFRRNIDTRRQWSVGNIGWNEWLSWEMVINDHCLGSVIDAYYCSNSCMELSSTEATYSFTSPVHRHCFSPYCNINPWSAKFLNFTGWISDSYCSFKSLWSGMGEVVPAHTSPTLHPPSPPTVL